MLKEALNKLITEVGSGTGCGNLMRHYWQPAALTEELPEDRPVKGVTLMGENLVLYRGSDNEYGLIGRACPHRGADLCYGRLEDGGLREVRRLHQKEPSGVRRGAMRGRGAGPAAID